MGDLKALLFDVDGTLADTERDGHRVAFNMAFEEAGLDWHWDEALYGKLLSVTGGKERIRHYLDTYNTEFQRPEELTDFIRGLHQAKTRFYVQLLAEGRVPLRPGVERLLRSAKEAGLRLAIVTTTTPENVDALLTHTLGKDSLNWFELIAAGDIVPAKKPAGDIYHYTLDKMNLNAAQCLAFEDSFNGLRSACEADLATIVTVNGYTREDDFNGASLVLDHLGESDQPYSVLDGDADGYTYVDIDQLKALHSRCY